MQPTTLTSYRQTPAMTIEDTHVALSDSELADMLAGVHNREVDIKLTLALLRSRATASKVDGQGLPTDQAFAVALGVLAERKLITLVWCAAEIDSVYLEQP